MCHPGMLMFDEEAVTVIGDDDWKPFTLLVEFFGSKKFFNFDPPTFKGLSVVFPLE